MKKRMLAWMLLVAMLLSVSAVAGAEEKVKFTLMSKVVANSVDLERANFKALEEKFGIELEVEIPPYTNYEDRVRLLVVSGDELPDAIQDIPVDLIPDLLEMEIIIPVDEYVENSTYLKEIYEKYPGYLKANTYDGKLAGIPRMGYNRGLGGTYMRYDWAVNLGLEDLIDVENARMTLENFETLITAMTFNDPDGNGENDTYGFGMPAGSTWNTYVPNIIQGAFDSGNVFKLSEDGTRYYNGALEDQWDNYLAAMRYFKGLINKGVVDPEVFALTREQFRERWYKGKVGTAFTFGSTMSYTSFYPPMSEINPDVQLTWLQNLENADGQYKVYLNGLNGPNQCWYITKDCEDPAKLMELIDYSVSQEGYLLMQLGVEGEHYTLVDGKPALTTQEQVDAYNAFHQGKLVFVDLQSYPEFPQYSRLILDEDVRKKLEVFGAAEALGHVMTDNVNIVIPVYDRVDRFKEYDNALSQEVLKYLTTPEIDESGVQSARDNFINSREYKEYWELVTNTYREAGIIE